MAQTNAQILKRIAKAKKNKDKLQHVPYKISDEDSAWVIEKLLKWKISDVFRLLRIFGCHLTAVSKKKGALGVQKKKASKSRTTSRV